jgi:hypothetical protein
MTTLQMAVRLISIAWLLGMAGTVAFGLLTGRINVQGLLSEKRGPDRGRSSPVRVQLFLATLATATTYLLQAMATTNLRQLPAVSPEWLAVMGGSSGVYLAGKVLTVFRIRGKSTGP